MEGHIEPELPSSYGWHYNRGQWLRGEIAQNLGGAMGQADQVEHRESGMIGVAMTYQLCSPHILDGLLHALLPVRRPGSLRKNPYLVRSLPDRGATVEIIRIFV